MERGGTGEEERAGTGVRVQPPRMGLSSAPRWAGGCVRDVGICGTLGWAPNPGMVPEWGGILGGVQEPRVIPKQGGTPDGSQYLG